MSAPKLFVSYSWTDPDHEQWVLDLSTRLRERGVDVILDKWDLQEGHDANAFMEKMVNDPNVRKVVLISDEAYARKANARSGGVGTEALIISQEIYQNAEQSKFVAVLPTRDDAGKPYLPTYYSGRLYIDLSNPNTHADEFDKLLRWIFDKPLNVKPPIGAVPTFLKDGPTVSLGTDAVFTRAIDAIRAGKANADGATADYLETFTTNLDRFRPVRSPELEFCDASLEMIQQLASAKDQFAQFVVVACRYPGAIDTQRQFQGFFERLLPYTDLAPGFTGSHRTDQFDVFRFIAYELFLTAMAVTIGEERFAVAEALLSARYYHPTGGIGRTAAAVGYSDFDMGITTFSEINERKGTNFLEPMGEFVKERSAHAPVPLRRLMQADFILYLRGVATKSGHWWPRTLIHAWGEHGPFEVFARAVSRSYFDKIKGLLGVKDVAEFKALIDGINTNPRQGLGWRHVRISIGKLANYEAIGVVP